MEQRVHKGKSAVFLSVLYAVRIDRSADIDFKAFGVVLFLYEFDVFSHSFEIKFLTLNLFGKLLPHLVLQSKQFLFISALQITKPCHFHIKFHFSLDFRVG